MNWLNYHHLYYFWMIAKEGSITQACKKLSLSQPTLSGQLKSFEKSLGKDLFERKSRKMILTESGKLVFDYADSIFQMGRELIDAIENQKEKGLIDFRVGVLATLPKKNIHNILRQALRQVHIRLFVHVGQVDELFLNLKQHHLDAVITHFRAPPEYDGLTSYHLEKVPVVFVASREYRNLKKKFPHSLAGQPLFLPSHKSYLRSEIDQYFARHNVELNVKGEVQDSELLRVIAASGDGIVPIERSAVSDLIKSKELVVLKSDMGVFEDFYLITEERKNQHPVVSEILKQY